MDKSSRPTSLSKEDFKAEKVELSWLPIPNDIKEAILTGEGVVDRSGYLMKASSALLSCGLKENEILSVLTDPTNYLSSCAYEHAKTNSRKRAAEWVYKYTLASVVRERSGDVFKDVPIPEFEEEPEPKEPHWSSKLVKQAKGNLKPCFMNSLLIFENEFGVKLFHKDDFSLRRTYGVNTPWGGRKGRELSDEDITAMRRYVCEKYRLELEEKHIVPTITSISYRNHDHPVTGYLDSLKWDGIPRVDTWLKDFMKVKADERYLKAISRKVLCAMVTRAYRPGAKFDFVLILEGPNQGEGKSRSIKALASPDWAGTVRFDMDHKDFVLALQGRWVTEIGELSGLGRRNMNFIKAIVSEETDRIRHPYGRFTETLPRQGIFIGTTNHFQYLEDETGNRRFWPVRVGKKIDVEGLKKVRDQLFAEAKIMVEKDEPLYLEDPEVEKIARKIQASRMTEDSWEEKIGHFFDEENLEKGEMVIDENKFKLLDLFKKGPLLESIDSENNLRRASRALRRLGYAPKVSRGKNGLGRYWKKIRKTKEWTDSKKERRNTRA